MLQNTFTKPSFVVNEAICRQNIKAMADKATRNQIDFRPHFKTHQSHEIGAWFRDYGVHKITVSSLSMANYFAADGWTDITVAFPVNILEIETINQLAGKVQLNLLFESIESIQMLSAKLNHPVAALIKIDSGSRRTGVPATDFETIDQLIQSMRTNSFIDFKGFLAHAGHSYKARSHAEIEKVHRSSLSAMRTLAARYQASYPDLCISVGDTPTCSQMEDFSGATEFRPGNFVFYDLMQNQIGACTLDQISVAIACPVVATHPDRNQLIIYGGGVHFSKDQLDHPPFNEHYGLVFETWGTVLENVCLKKLSQEHGIIEGSSDFIRTKKLGDLLWIYPVHSCMSANLMPSYYHLDGRRIACMLNSI